MKGIVLLVIAVIAVITGLSVYLAPDGLSNCEAKPGGTSDCQKVGAIVAISGGDTPARTEQAIELYQNGWADKLVFSGAALDKSGPSNAEVMKRQAIAAGVSESVILTEETSENTQQNAAMSLSVFEDNDIHSVILVTSAYHQRRAGLEFGRTVGSSVRVVNHPVAEDKQWSPWWWTTPGGWWLALGEFFKIIIFYGGGYKS